MKKSEIEKQLKKDLSESPSDFNAVWERCNAEERIKAPVLEAVTNTGHVKNKIKPVLFTLLLCTCCLVVLLCVLLIPKNASVGGGYFTIDVNPSVQVSYNGEGVVTSAVGRNADGEELIDGLSLNGQTYEKALDVLFDRLVEKGYFTAERQNAVLMTASKSDGQKDEEMTAKIQAKLAGKFTDKTMQGVVISDVDNEKYQKEAEKYQINGQKYELILRYLEAGGKLSEEEYQTVTIEQLYSFLSEAEKDFKDK